VEGEYIMHSPEGNYLQNTIQKKNTIRGDWFEDTKRVIRNRKFTDKQNKDKEQDDKRTNIDLQNTTQKTKY
jgi:hypothetical protein